MQPGGDSGADANNIWQGRLVRLRAVEPWDWEFHYGWDHDSEMARSLDRVHFPHSTEAARRWAERVSTREPVDDTFRFEIENLNGEVVGTIATHSCDHRNGTFEYGVAIREGHKRKGYASEAIKLVLRYYFQELRYQKVTAHIYSFNEASVALHTALGFVEEGRIRRKIFTGGKYSDELVYGMTREEFEH